MLVYLLFGFGKLTKLRYMWYYNGTNNLLRYNPKGGRQIVMKLAKERSVKLVKTRAYMPARYAHVTPARDHVQLRSVLLLKVVRHQWRRGPWKALEGPRAVDYVSVCQRWKALEGPGRIVATGLTGP